MNKKLAIVKISLTNNVLFCLLLLLLLSVSTIKFEPGLPYIRAYSLDIDGAQK